MKRLLCVLLIGCGSDTITVSEGGTDAGGMDASDDKSLDNYVPPMCGMSAWLTYGHDAKRTFATDACISGPLTVSWTYTPMPPAMKTVKAMHHVIAAPDAIYLQWAASAGQYIGTTAASTPASAISAGNGFVYLVEGAEFVARKQSDGMKAWSQAVTQPGAQAPVLANGLVIVGTQTGVSAFDAQSGSRKWQSPAPGAGAHAYTIDISNGCSGLQHLGAPIATSIAAAIPSGTLVVTASDGVHVLRLADGTEQWKGSIPGAKNAVHDPVLVGNIVYVMDSPPSAIGGFGTGQLIALKGT